MIIKFLVVLCLKIHILDLDDVPFDRIRFYPISSFLAYFYDLSNGLMSDFSSFFMRNWYRSEVKLLLTFGHI